MANPYKIAILSHHTLGGSSKLAYILANLLSNREDFEVHLFSLFKPWFADNLREKVTLHSLYKNYGLNYSFREEWTQERFDQFYDFLSHQFIENSIDIVHAHYAFPFVFILSEMKKNYGAKTILTLHGTDVTKPNSFDLYPDIYKKLDDMDEITVVSQYLENSARLNYKTSRDIKVIYNFTDIPINEENQSPSRHVSSMPIVIHISNFNPIKQTPQIIDIFRHINKNVPCKLVMIGEGPEKKQCEEMVSKYQLQNSVTFLGQQLHIENFLRDSKIMLISSLNESFSLTAIEALTCGVPVVAPRVGGIPEVVQDKVNGFLYTSNAIEEAASHSLNLLRDPALYEKISQNAVQSSKKFDPLKQIEKYIDLYR